MFQNSVKYSNDKANEIVMMVDHKFYKYKQKIKRISRGQKLSNQSIQLPKKIYTAQ